MKTLQSKEVCITIGTVKSIDDIVATLRVINETYKSRPMMLIQVSRSQGAPVKELKDTPTRIIVKDKFNIREDSANDRIAKLIDKGLIEIDPQRSYQAWRAYQRVYRLTGKGLQLLAIED